MVRNLLNSSLFLLFAFALSGQTLDSNPLTYSGQFEACPLEKHEFIFTVSNPTDGDVSAFWGVTGVDVPDEWVIQVCDARTCYEEGRTSCPSDKPNEFLPMQSIDYFSFKVIIPDDVFEVDGIGDFDFVMFNSQDSTDIFFTLPIVITGTQCLSAVHDVEIVNAINVFPNPTSDLFQVADDREIIESISIYNIIGREVKSFDKSPNGFYNIADINDGMYLVRMFDEDGDLVKVSRLSKK